MSSHADRRDRRDLQRLLGELKTIQDAHRGRHMPERVGRAFEAKAKQAEQLQRELEDHK